VYLQEKESKFLGFTVHSLDTIYSTCSYRASECMYWLIISD